MGYMLGAGMKDTSLNQLSGGGLTGAVQNSKLAGGSYEDNMNKSAAPASGGGGGGYTLEEVAMHTSKSDCWVVVAGQVLNVTNFLSEHPGGELAILTFAGKDATEEFNMIHPPDVIGKYAPDSVIGEIGTGGGGGGGAAVELPPGMSAYSMEEVAKHTTKSNDNRLCDHCRHCGHLCQLPHLHTPPSDGGWCFECGACIALDCLLNLA